MNEIPTEKLLPKGLQGMLSEKRECMAQANDINNHIIDRAMNELFDTPNATCRTCKHRERWELNDHSSKVIQCCNLQPSKRSNSGYKTIKVTDKACLSYETK